MPGLVFVRDAQGRPLMPTSPAYARTLLRRGSARRHSHPTLTILELTHAVPTPALRPILLGLVVHGRTADLLIAIDHARGPAIGLHLVADLHVEMPLFGRPQRQRWGKVMWGRPNSRKERTGRNPSNRRSSVFSISQWRVEALTAIIMSLQEILPISHLLVPSLEEYVTSSRLGGCRIEQRVANMVTGEGSKIALVDPVMRQQDRLPSSLYDTIDTMVTKAHLSTLNYVACYLNEPKKAPQPSALKRTRTGILGQVGTVRHHRQQIVGIIMEQFVDGRLVLHVPLHGNAKRVTWTKVVVPATTPRQLWGHMPVLLFPIIKE